MFGSKFLLSKSLPVIRRKNPVGRILPKKIKPKAKGLMRRCSTEPNLIQRELRGVRKEGIKREDIRKKVEMKKAQGRIELPSATG